MHLDDGRTGDYYGGMENPRTNLAASLRRLREARGLTQAELAEKAGMSRVGYRKVELGESSPRSRTLLELAGALGVSLGALLRPVPQLSHVRFRSRKRLNSREHVLAQVTDWLSNFSQLEEVLGDRRPFELASLTSRGDAVDAAPVALARAARVALDLDGVEPIRDICGLLDSAGVKVCAINIATDGFFGLSVASEDGGPAVVVNTWERIAVERWIFTAAHELGHLLLHRDAYDAADGGERVGEEKEADSFAAHFLLPEGAFNKEWAASAGMGFVDRVLRLKRMFRVSYQTVLYRLSENPSYGSQVWPRFQAQFSRQYGRTLQKRDEPDGLQADAFRAATERAAEEPDSLSPSDFTEDRLRLLVRRAIERDVITLARGAEVLGVGVGEMRTLASTWVE